MYGISRLAYWTRWKTKQVRRSDSIADAENENSKSNENTETVPSANTSTSDKAVVTFPADPKAEPLPNPPLTQVSLSLSPCSGDCLRFEYFLLMNFVADTFSVLLDIVLTQCVKRGDSWQDLCSLVFVLKKAICC